MRGVVQSVRSQFSRRFLLLALCDFLRAGSPASPVGTSAGGASTASEAALLRPCLLGVAMGISLRGNQPKIGQRKNEAC